MLKYKNISNFLALVIAGCGSNVQTDRAYQELGRAQHFYLNSHGYIIGIEKRSIKTGSGLLPGLDSEKPYQKRFRPIKIIDETSQKRNEKFQLVTTGQQKVMLATQITKHTPKLEYVYNSYAEDLDGKYNYETSFSQVDEMFKHFEDRLRNSEMPYSHVLIMSMGWNNDQVESLWRYNKILDNLTASAKKNHDKTFNPIVIVFTWPSAWFTISDSIIQKTLGHLLSYPNKANDADEIGFTWANWIINHKVPEAIKAANLEKTPKTVVVGHSFGARLLSRALFSSEYIHPDFLSYNSVDLFLGLQGAFSANRFVPNGGVEGNPYSNFRKLPTKIVLTTSVHDKDNPIAYWITRAGHVGGQRGLDIAEDEGNSTIFDVKLWCDQSPEMDLPTNKVLMVNASTIVNEENELKLSGHNDILDKEMGDLMWNFIRKIP